MKTDITPLVLGCLLLTRKDRVSERRHVLNERNRLLARIEAALTRMEEGRYGLCATCNGRIPLRQLEQDPALTRCQDCKDAEKRTGA